jgi:AraC-like DNA-binding protein
MRKRPGPNDHDRLRLKYLYGGAVVYQPGETLGPRMLNDFEVVFIIDGHAVYTARSVARRVPAGGMVLGRPGTDELYRWAEKVQTHHAYFHFGVESLPVDWPDTGQWPRVIPHPSPVTVSLFRHILRHIYKHQDWPAMSPPAADSRLVETLLDCLFETHEQSDALFDPLRPVPVQRALKWMREVIDQSPGRPVSLRDLARAARVTEKHLCRIFHHSLGFGPAKTYTLLRLQLAIPLLARSNLRVQEIAERCGFQNALYFSRCFSKNFGRCPKKVRDDLSNGVPPPADPLPADLTPRLYW